MRDGGLFLPWWAAFLLRPRGTSRKLPPGGAGRFAEWGARGRRRGSLFRLGLGKIIGKRAFDEEQRLRGDGHGVELTRGHHAVDDFADARARGERREEDFGFFGGSGDGRAEIDGEENGKRGGLRGIGCGGELLGAAIFEEGPAGGLAGGVDGHRAEVGPELDKGAEDGGFGKLAAEAILNLNGGQLAFAIEGFPRAQDDGGCATAGGGFPLAVAANGCGPGKDLRSDEEVGLFGNCAEEVEGDGATFFDEAGGEFNGACDGGGGWSDGRRAAAGFNEGWCGGGKLGVTWQEEAEADFVEPGGSIVEGDQMSVGGLVPQRGAREL